MTDSTPEAGGGDFSPTDEAQATITASATSYSWDITGMMKQWASGTANNGILIRTNKAANRGPRELRLKRDTSTDTASWPRIRILYRM